MKAFRLDNNRKRFVLDPVSHSLKKTLVMKCKELWPSFLFINDYLTKSRHNLMYEVRKLRDTYPALKKIYSNRGRIYIVIETATSSESGPPRPHLVRELNDALKLLASTPRTTA